MYELTVQVLLDGGALHESIIRFGMPNNPTDDDVKVVARGILRGYRDLYGTRVKHAGLRQVGMTREIASADVPIPPTP